MRKEAAYYPITLSFIERIFLGEYETRTHKHFIDDLFMVSGEKPMRMMNDDTSSVSVMNVERSSETRSPIQSE